MKKTAYFVFLFFTLNGFGQQVPQFSQYFYERFLYNPAYAGTNSNAIEVALSFRRQNVGYYGKGEWENAFGGNFPTGYDSKSISSTNNIAIHAPLRKINMAIGGRFIHENVSFYDFTGFWTTAAYQLKFPQAKLSFGAEIGLIQSRLNTSKLNLVDSYDNALGNYNSPSYSAFGNFTPDLGLGIYYNRKHFYTGLYAAHVVPFSLTPYTADYSRDKRAVLSRHYMAMIGGVIPLNPTYSLEPSGLFKIIETGTFQYDLTMLLNYKQLFAFGASYRSQKAVVGVFRVTILKNIHLSYSYDYVFSQIGKFSAGSHELLLRYIIGLKPLHKKINVDPRHYY